MRIIFMGTPDFSVKALAALAEAGHEIAAVYCQPPRPAGRGQKDRPSPVQAFAETQGWAVCTPASLKDPEAQTAFKDLAADVAVVVAYGLLLPEAILAAPRLGCLNIHASLLPRWRGAAPIQRALLAGDPESGISIMQMDKGLDTGAVHKQSALPISADETGGSLHDRLADLGAEMIVEVLTALNEGTAPTPRPQAGEGVTYAEKISKSETGLNWTWPATHLERQVRAFAPWPGAWTACGALGTKKQPGRIKVLEAAVVQGKGAPGHLLDNRLTVACGDGQALRLLRVQRAGKGAMSAEAFLRGTDLRPGMQLGPPLGEQPE
ncbi:MAG: methionyl-tRNA formyltransferase [Pseudomonadota bacterium]